MKLTSYPCFTINFAQIAERPGADQTTRSFKNSYNENRVSSSATVTPALKEYHRRSMAGRSAGNG